MSEPVFPEHVVLQVSLGERSYPIHIGAGLLGSGIVRRHVQSRQVAVVSNEVVAPLHGNRLLGELGGLDVRQIILRDGEQEKNLENFNAILTRMLESGFSRNCTLIALGGGVVGDLCGFAAACYMRGVRFIQVPTTLLAQVDSSVGGKTAVNHPLGKNMIGAFHQPVAVVADTGLLETLPEREYLAGLAEVIKYGLIRDAVFLDWLEQNIGPLRRRAPDALAHAVHRSCQNKAEVVAADERESGQRALLNLGHTFGHAIETAQEYRGLLHGEAVAVGMVMAAGFSEQTGLMPPGSAARVRSLLERTGLPVDPPPGLSAEEFLAIMARDKKAVDGKMRLILMNKPGEAFVCDAVPVAALREYLGECLAGAAVRRTN